MQAYRVIIPKILEQNKLLREQEGVIFFVTQEDLNTNYALPNAFKTWKK